MAAVEYNRPASHAKSMQNETSENHLSMGPEPLRMLHARTSPKTLPLSRAQSFPGVQKWNDVAEFKEPKGDFGSGLFFGPDRHVDHDLGFHGQGPKRITLPTIIREDVSDLIDSPLAAGTGSPNPSTSAAWAPIWGYGLPSTSDLPRSVAEPSEVTDFGHQMYSELKTQGRVPSFPADEDEFDSSLADRIFEASRENSRDRKDFLPKSQLDRLIHTSSVTQELRACFPLLGDDKIRAYSDQICHGSSGMHAKNKTKNVANSYQKVFAILVLINKLEDVELFLHDNVCDADLPLQRHTEEVGRRHKFGLRRRKDPHRQLECFSSWDQITLRNFEQYQWAMIPPFFTKGELKNVKHYVLDPSTVLPFTFTENTNSKSKAKVHRGGYSLVYQADIHPDHHNFNSYPNYEGNTSENTFAIKRLDSPSKEAFQKEVQILKRFSGDAHPHLISLLATYEMNDTFYLIFPWAGADLKTYWKSENPTPTFDAATVIWMAEQCKGLAEGLTKLHQYETGLLGKSESPKNERLGPNIVLNGGQDTGRHSPLYGRHGDIKPENILWFAEHEQPGHRGVLKISDFGLSELNSRYSKSKRRSHVPNSPTYRPPECDLRQKVIKQSYDIWTLGCLYLEFIAWTLGGWELVNDFACRRRSMDPVEAQSDCFFEIRDLGTSASVDAFVKPNVVTFVSELHAHPRCSDFFHCFLDMIMTEMLIVESASIRRMGCMQVMQRLTTLHLKCKKDAGFALEASPSIR